MPKAAEAPAPSLLLWHIWVEGLKDGIDTGVISGRVVCHKVADLASNLVIFDHLQKDIGDIFS
jgi:hypothetical protein